jgi:hypothetical protein
MVFDLSELLARRVSLGVRIAVLAPGRIQVSRLKSKAACCFEACGFTLLVSSTIFATILSTQSMCLSQATHFS